MNFDFVSYYAVLITSTLIQYFPLIILILSNVCNDDFQKVLLEFFKPPSVQKSSKILKVNKAKEDFLSPKILTLLLSSTSKLKTVHFQGF